MFNGCRVSVWEDEKSSGGDGCTTMLIYLMLLTYKLKMVKIVNFRLCIFYYDKKIKKFKDH